MQGYTLNRQRLAEKGIAEIRQILELLTNTLEHHDLVNEDGRSVLALIKNYARNWQLLWQYDEESLPMPGNLTAPYTLTPALFKLSKRSRDLILSHPCIPKLTHAAKHQ